MAKRTFVVVGHKVSTAPDFTLDDLAGSTGRLDILLRAIHSALLISHGVRRDSEIYLVLRGPPDPPITLRVDGEKVRYLNPDERSTGALVRQALIKARKLGSETGSEWMESTPGFFVSRKGLGDVLDLFEKRDLIYLHEKGEDIRGVDLSGEEVYLLSDHVDFTPEEENLIEKKGARRISLGPVNLHTHHAIILVHNELDRRGV